MVDETGRDVGGRPQYEPTEADRNTVRSMAACGMTQEAIARCIGTDGVDPKTLRVHFRNELNTAMDKANARIGQVAFQKATEGEAWAVCFWLKTRAGWKETQVTEHTGPDGKPLLDVAAVEAFFQRRKNSDDDYDTQS